jgi:maleylacetate reductase
VTTPSHTPSFAGELVVGAEPLPDRALVLAARELTEQAFAAGLVPDDVAVLVADDRPDRHFVDEAVAVGAAEHAGCVAAIGSGALIDGAKLVALELGRRCAAPVGLTFVPCGSEPYRAFARFAVVDDDGTRPTVVDERFGRARVLLVPALLAEQDEGIVAVHALDTAVHAIESLLSTRTHPYARLLAASALRTVSEEIARVAERPAVACTRLVAAAAAAADAFATTRLGLAHAVASPLGTRLGVTHDAINGVLGEIVIEFWGEGVPGFADIAAALGVAPSRTAVREALACVRLRAALPSSLAELGIDWDSVRSILPFAGRSSGIAVLPEPVDSARIESFAFRAWAGGDPTEEVSDRGAA